jgi:hypothetical protein
LCRNADVAYLIVDANLIQSAGVNVVMKPARWTGEDTSGPALCRVYMSRAEGKEA